ncbi:BCCT family transporter [Halomonas sp. DP8Y7-1]|uniref:BCCT family transporter n=1 Tax=Halomonas sp. DP8Y7-1 TaxID=2859078 RepID=UPI0021BDC635|nr:BCCT family transporter [Halomonas sp. DP8Y7-1]MED5297177.1 BCCT family transporter [Pseudomonadota bacterium]
MTTPDNADPLRHLVTPSPVENKNMSASSRRPLRKAVFIPTFSIIMVAVATGLINNDMLVDVAKGVFYISLSDFGWLYQLIAVTALVVSGFIFFSRAGDIRLGGKDATPTFSFAATFAMALTGGIATGVVTYSVNEPIIYLGNIYGEISHQSFAPGSGEAAIFALARSFHNWSFIPYALYSIVGLMIGYMHFNRRERFSISSTVSPVLGRHGSKIWVRSLIDIISVLAIALGLASSLGAGLALISSGIEAQYGIESNAMTWLVLTIAISAIFITSAVSGLKRGIRVLSSINAYIFYAFVAILIIVGPLNYILSLSVTSLGYWADNFFLWAFDTKESGGEALVTWWTMYDWSIWIAYAPLMGLFLARISYGRTLREFLIINWILPSVFGLVWFAIWGGSALKWQMDGTLDLISIINDSGAVSGLWGFLQHLPMASLLVPLAIFTLVISFATAADSMSSTIATICTSNMSAEEESPKQQKILWGLSIAAIAYVMVAFGGGAQGVDGIKYLAAAGGFTVVFLFVLILISAVRTFMTRSPQGAAKQPAEVSQPVTGGVNE